MDFTRFLQDMISGTFFFEGIIMQLREEKPDKIGITSRNFNAFCLKDIAYGL